MSSIQLSSIGDNATPHNVFASSTGGRINELSFSEGETKRKKEAGIKINRTKKRNEKGKLKVPIKNEQPSHPVFPNGHAIIHGYINRVLLKKWPVSLPLHPPRSLYCPFCLLPSPSPPLIHPFSLSLFPFFFFKVVHRRKTSFAARVPRILRGYHQQEPSSMVYVQRVPFGVGVLYGGWNACAWLKWPI